MWLWVLVDALRKIKKCQNGSLLKKMKRPDLESEKSFASKLGKLL